MQVSRILLACVFIIATASAPGTATSSSLDYGYDDSSINGRIFNEKNFCMNQKLPAGYTGYSAITIGKVFSFTVPVNFTTTCGTEVDHSRNICENVICNNECVVCGKPYSDPPLQDDKSFHFNMSGLFNRATLATLAGPRIVPPKIYQQELGGLACNFTFDMDVDKYCTVACVAKNNFASFQDIWRWIVTVTGPTPSGDPLYVDMGAYLHIKFLAGDIMLPSSKVEVISSLDLVAGDYLLFSITFYDGYGNVVGPDTTGHPGPNSWEWFWTFTGTSSLGVTILNNNGLATVTPTADHGKLMLITQTAKAGQYILLLGAGNGIPQGAPVHFSVSAGPISISHSRCEILAQLVTAGSQVVIIVILLDQFGNGVDVTDQILKDFTAGTKLLDFHLYQNIPKISIAPGTGNLTISFVPLIATTFHLRLGSPSSQIPGSPFPFRATPGAVSAADSLGYTTQNIYPASDYRLVVYITQMDEFKNLVSTPVDKPVWTCYFQRVGDDHGQILPSFDVLPSYSKFDQPGTVQILLVSIPKKVDQYLLYITTLDKTMLSSCPFTITIIPGTVSMTRSTATYVSQGPFSPGASVAVKIMLLDDYGNIAAVTPVKKTLDFQWKVVIMQTDGTFVSRPLLTLLTGPNGSLTFSFSAPNMSNFNYKLHIGNLEAEFSFSPLDMVTSESPSFYIPACFGVLDKSKGAAGTTFHLYVTIADLYGNRMALTDGILQQITQMLSITHYPSNLPLLPVPGLYVHGYNARPNNLQYYGRVFIEFVPQIAGQYFMQVQRLKQSVSGAPLPFTVSAGAISVTASAGFWQNDIHTFTPGDEAVLKVRPVDGFGNNVSFGTGVYRPSLTFSAQILEPLPTSVPVIVHSPDDSSGYYTVSFFPVVPGGDFHLQVGSGNQFIGGSPFLFSVNIGDLSVPNCTGAFIQKITEFAAGSLVTFTIFQMDAFGNPIHMLANSTDYHKFTASVYKTLDDSDMPVKIVDMKLRPTVTSSATTDSQTLTFSIVEAGRLLLSVTDLESNSIYGSPFSFTCVPGSLNLTKTIIEGPGLKDTFAGDVATFQVQFEDSYGNPTHSSSLILVVKITILDAVAKAEVIKVHVLEIPGSLGLYNVTYALNSTGRYNIGITAQDSTNLSLVMSPRAFNKTVLAGPIDPSACVAFGEGLQGGVAGAILKFSVSLHDVYNNVFPAGVLNVTFVPATSAAAVNVSYGSGKAVVEYTVGKIPDTGSVILMHVTAGSNQIGYSVASVATQTEIPLSPFRIAIEAGPVSIQACTGLWLNGQNQFTAGTQGRLLISQRDQYGNIVSAFSGYTRFAHKVLNTVSNAQINTSSTLQITPYGTLGQGAQLITITFSEPGKYIIEVGSANNPFVPILGSPFAFSYKSGTLSIPSCDGKWLNNTSMIKAGDEAKFVVTARDSLGNILTNVSVSSFVVKVTDRDSPQAYLSLPSLQVQRFGLNTSGEFLISFHVMGRGEYLLYIGDQTTGISGSPFNFTLAAGDVDLKTSFVTGEGLSVLASVSLSNSVVVHLLDVFGNGVRGKVTVLSLDVTGPGKVVVNQFGDLANGLYGASYVTDSVGVHSVVIHYLDDNFPGSPFSVNVAQSGGVRASNCVAEISPTSHVQAGQAVLVTIHAYDSSHSSVPSAQALKFNVEIMPHPKSSPSNSSADVQKEGGGTYFATLRITEAGSYNLLITLFGTNIGGGPYGLIVDSVSWAVRTSVASGTGLQNQAAGVGKSIAVQLSDEYGNSVTTKRDQVYPSVFSVDVVGVFSVPYTFNLGPLGNGTYSGTVDWKQAGLYTVRIYSGTEQVKDSPFSVTISPGPVFVPSCIGLGSGLTTAIAQRAENIWVQLKDEFGNTVLENRDEQGNEAAFSFSIADNGQQADQFNRLANGLFFAKYVVLGDGQYQLSIKSGNLHISSSPFTVDVTSNYIQEFAASPVKCTTYDNLNASTVLNLPYILSMPSVLTVLEGRPVPLQGGVPCMEVGYKDPTVQLSVRLTALHGLFYLVQTMEELWQYVVAASEVAVSAVENLASKSLEFSGTIPAINSALQATQYAGTGYYNGKESFTLQVFNPKGAGAEVIGDIKTVQMDIGAVNDPPYIVAEPTLVATWDSGSVHGISVGDPDQADTRADKKVLMLQVCSTVDVGQISINLTSAKGMNASTYDGHTWLPIPSAHNGKLLSLSGKGICFTASVDDCNTALGSSLVWKAEDSAAVGSLNVSVNDLGNFGCYGDCSTTTRVSLQDSVVIQLVQGRKPAVQGRPGLITGSVVGLLGGLVVLLLFLFLCRRHIKLCGVLEVYIKRRLENFLGIDSTKLNSSVQSQEYKPSWILPPRAEPLKFRFGEFTGDESMVDLSQTALEQIWSESVPPQTYDPDADDDTDSWERNGPPGASEIADLDQDVLKVHVEATSKTRVWRSCFQLQGEQVMSSAALHLPTTRKNITKS